MFFLEEHKNYDGCYYIFTINPLILTYDFYRSL